MAISAIRLLPGSNQKLWTYKLPEYDFANFVELALIWQAGGFCCFVFNNSKQDTFDVVYSEAVASMFLACPKKTRGKQFISYL